MKLRRGLERESCDFCYRRKVKCDRSARANLGYSACSQCDLRRVPCHIDNSGDLRKQKREDRSNIHHRASSSQIQISDPARDTTSVDSDRPLLSLTSTHLLATSLLGVDSTTPVPDQTSDFLFLDSLLDMKPENVLFLDQTFISDYDPTIWTSEVLHSIDPIAMLSTSRDIETQPPDQQPTIPPLIDRLSQKCNINHSVLHAALHGYFDFAGLCLPIIYEDAFWTDCHAGLCSPALVYAIACRGIPFINVEPPASKTKYQHQLACGFRESFFEAQQTTIPQESIRLDNLEALALMINYEYDNDNADPSSSISSHLGSLFLTLDSLVLMILQSRIDTHDSSSAMTTLCRATQRRSLLFWHVYGLDAFQSLDHKRISRIQDDTVEITDRLSRDEIGDGGYLDAMLSLAIIARRIVQLLCSPIARRRGVSSDDVQSLYDQLRRWRKHSCSDYLEWDEKVVNQSRLMDRGEGFITGKHMKLYQAVVKLLEFNCYLQIEDCVIKYGIQEKPILGGEILSLQVQYQSLRAACGIADVCGWISHNHIEGRQGKEGHCEVQYFVIDLSPDILRNLCAGACYWLCIRCKTLSCRGFLPIPQPNSSLSERDGREQDGADADVRYIKGYIETAKQLRDGVAVAKSHKDTEKIVARLDEQLSSLQKLINN
ncbi:hypothetical protein BGW36DRAFT_429696 [Talaromyces proteolyticus]|uniref:Zn(2)-C6 fungal-type domain-containing protein n=1 Tax=Talaromyces proteolyticus TaxID=1131652 RepID=A0AAD4PY39_9EURO|nr:uncharacterized protein BGW36DRAFT_429696 [Talaromyces proteolyticus]KAH8693656.1 hypothetical protein BGW36DRAFT_429696 [Talaromyces proteolyticus]